jgi:hypothetical protein
MTVVRKYPTVVVNSGIWLLPDNVKVEDGNCAAVNDIIVCDAKLTCSGFGFAIPAGSTINKVTIGMHSKLINELNLATALNWLIYCPLEWPSILSSASNGAGGYACSDCTDWSVSQIQSVVFPFEPDDFNAPEQFVAELHAVCTNNNGWVWKARTDNVWIEVDYTEPPVSGSSQGNCAIIALAAINQWIRRRKKRRFIATVK